MKGYRIEAVYNDLSEINKIASIFKAFNIKYAVKKIKASSIQETFAELVINQAVKYYGMPLNDILTFKKSDKIVLVQQVCCYIIKDYLPLFPIPLLAKIFNKERTTIYKQLNVTTNLFSSKLTKDLESTKEIKKTINYLKSELEADAQFKKVLEICQKGMKSKETSEKQSKVQAVSV